MAEINLEDNILKLTLGDIVQSFSEEQLQQEMPIFMQDIDAETKELVDTYQSYLAAGDFATAETYRANNLALETRIWDAFKANSMMAYSAYVYMYAKVQNQQCVFSETQPSEGNGDDSVIGQVEGDIWFRTDSNDGMITVTPFVKQADGTYQEFSFTSIEKLNSCIEINIEANAWVEDSGVYTYTTDANVTSGERHHWYMMPLNGLYITDEDVEIDFALKGMNCLDGKITFYSSSNISKSITIIVEGIISN